MELKLLKLTRSAFDPLILFADFELVEKEMIMAGCRFNSKTKKLLLPSDRTGNNNPYSTAKFVRQNDYAEFILKGTTLILNNKEPIIDEILTEKTKRRLAQLKQKKANPGIPNRPPGQKKASSPVPLRSPQKPQTVWHGGPYKPKLQGWVPPPRRTPVPDLDSGKGGD